MAAASAKKSQRGFIVLLLIAALAGGGYIYRDLLRGTTLGNWLGLKEVAQAKDVYYCPMHPDYKADKPGECPICHMALVKREPEKKTGPAEVAKAPAHERSAGDVYYCPMHPDYQSDKPGTCPICKMDLVKREPEKKEAVTRAPPPSERKILYWQDPMNPANRSDKPGKAPDGMDLVPVYAEEAPGETGAGPAGIFISPAKQQLIGVQVGTVQMEPLTRTIITVGQLTYDETRVARLQSKVEGWIEQVFVNFTGMWVSKGHALINIYSPELVSTQQELLIARRAKDKLESSMFPEIAANARSLYEATRDRLRLWDISEAQIREIEKRGAPSRTMTLSSPIEGYVLTRNAYRGQRVTPEMELYTIADLATIWVLADIYEYEVPMVKVGQSATMNLSYFPGQTYRGKVTFIYPQIDNQTRTLKVRLEFPNSDHKLKPDMYASVSLAIDYGRQLAVPETAVLDSGSQQMVFIAHENGHFEPRTVQLGAKVDDRFLVLSGISAGEKVVTSGNFLIDSESQLKAAIGGMGTGGQAGHGVSPAEKTGPNPAPTHQHGK
jgi:membrane fusion protein, copper/silver efflux system